MKAGRFNLPIIWRGSTYPTITFTWLDVNGVPLDLRGWQPVAKSENLDFKLGKEAWDWIWLKDNTPLVNTVTTPYLSGHVEIKEPVSKITPFSN